MLICQTRLFPLVSTIFKVFYLCLYRSLKFSQWPKKKKKSHKKKPTTTTTTHYYSWAAVFSAMWRSTYYQTLIFHCRKLCQPQPAVSVMCHNWWRIKTAWILQEQWPGLRVDLFHNCTFYLAYFVFFYKHIILPLPTTLPKCSNLCSCNVNKIHPPPPQDVLNCLHINRLEKNRLRSGQWKGRMWGKETNRDSGRF